jgi:hypothetical protein
LIRWMLLQCRIGITSRSVILVNVTSLTSLTDLRTVRFLSSQQTSKRIPRRRFLSYQAMVPRCPVCLLVSSFAKLVHTTIISASYLRQSVLLSAYETCETRALFNKNLNNVAGKVRTTKRWAPVGVPEGLDQVCSKRQVHSVDLTHLV